MRFATSDAAIYRISINNIAIIVERGNGVNPIKVLIGRYGMMIVTRVISRIVIQSNFPGVLLKSCL